MIRMIRRPVMISRRVASRRRVTINRSRQTIGRRKMLRPELMIHRTLMIHPELLINRELTIHPDLLTELMIHRVVKPGYRIKRKATPLPTPLAPESHVEGDNSTPRSHPRSPEQEASDAKAETAGADGGGKGREDGGEGESEQQAIKRRKAKARPPEGWLESSAGGEAIRGICPIKTPLSSNFNMPHPSDAWEVKECIAACGGERVKLLIDLTASSRYYSPEEVPPHVSYRKLPVAGHGLPSQGEVESALGWIKELQGDEIAVVHCTHGLNRTGARQAHPKGARNLSPSPYLLIRIPTSSPHLPRAAFLHGLTLTWYIVVRALVELHSFPLLQALENFAKLRPP
ncbi:MAG: hypothetical protein SGPRY_014968, partial [Prymnesium sp.]